MKYKIAVIVAEFILGQELMRILAERNFPFSNIFAVKSNKKNEIHFSLNNNEKLVITNLKELDFAAVDLIFLISNVQIPVDFLTQQKKLIIDLSEQFSLSDEVLSIVPEVNG